MTKTQDDIKTVFSPCGKYRYLFQQRWDETKPLVMFIGLNPTHIDPDNLNATLRRCIAYAKDWNYGGVCMANLFARLAPTPADLRKEIAPIGIENDRWLQTIAQDVDLIVAAWGNDGSYMDRSKQVQQLIKDLSCLKMNNSGEPAHPLYQPKTAVPRPFQL